MKRIKKIRDDRTSDQLQAAQAANPNSSLFGLEAPPDSAALRNIILSDRDVSRFIDASYGRDRKLGLLVHVLSESGARSSQATRLLVEDLHGGAKARLSVPRSAKGGSKNRGARKHERVNVPITPALAAKLKVAAKGRPGDAPLLLQADGQPWGDRPSNDYREDIAEIVQGLGLGSETTLYALRHSSIVRELLRGVPIRIIAATHDTSVAAIEKHYSKYIADHSDDLSRAALLDHKPPGSDNIVSIAGR